MKRTPLTRRVRLAPISPNRRRDLKRRAEVMRIVRGRDRDCRATAVSQKYPELPPTCAGPLDGHELMPRSAWKAGWLDPSNVILLCRKHHDWVHAHPVTAVTLGLLSPSWHRGLIIWFIG